MNIKETIHFLETSKDPDAMWKAFNKLNYSVEEKDLPILLEAMKSKTIGFGVREWLAESVIRLSGPKAIPNLMSALRNNFEEGHDNDSLQSLLIDLAEKHPEEVRSELEKSRNNANEKQVEDIEWLLEFCK